jgi:CRISPR-associated exonuclease Cas4
MINGTIVNYYFHCKRQCWLFYNRINLEDNSEDVRIGRVLHELKTEKQPDTIDNIKIDNITSEYIIEIKKSDADLVAAKEQLKFYLYSLRKKGIHRKGKIAYSGVSGRRNRNYPDTKPEHPDTLSIGSILF